MHFFSLFFSCPSITAKRGIIQCVPGETLSISLEGIKMVDATLHFYNNQSVVTLVENGVPVGSVEPDYMSRLKISGDNIRVLNVNTSDVGKYKLTDHKGRIVSNNTMILVGKNHISHVFDLFHTIIGKQQSLSVYVFASLYRTPRLYSK